MIRLWREFKKRTTFRASKVIERKIRTKENKILMFYFLIIIIFF